MMVFLYFIKGEEGSRDGCGVRMGVDDHEGAN